MLEHAPLLSDVGCKHVKLSKSSAHSWVNLLLETTRVAGSFIVYNLFPMPRCSLPKVVFSMWCKMIIKLIPGLFRIQVH